MEVCYNLPTSADMRLPAQGKLRFMTSLIQESRALSFIVPVDGIRYNTLYVGQMPSSEDGNVMVQRAFEVIRPTRVEISEAVLLHTDHLIQH
jgi:hypothetical protein